MSVTETRRSKAWRYDREGKRRRKVMQKRHSQYAIKHSIKRTQKLR